MRINHFFIKEAIDKDEIIIYDKNLLHQWRNVFRMTVGDTLYLLDNSGYKFLVTITEFYANSCVFRLEKKEHAYTPKKKLCLFQAVIKKDKFEWVTEKATEVGVSDIHPIISRRSEKKGVVLHRLNIIAKEASEQCGRGILPTIDGVLTLEDSLEKISGSAIVFHPSGEKITDELMDSPTVSIFIGPEGGWDDSELDIFRQKGCAIVSLGEQILKSETAALIACAKFLI